MVSQFLFLKSYSIIINVADVLRIEFTPANVDDESDEVLEDACLDITCRESDNLVYEGDDAEELFPLLLKYVPNIIVVE